MSRCQTSLLFVCLFVLSLIDSAAADKEDTTNTTKTTSLSDNDLECFIWIAPSTLEGAGLGMFAGKDFKADEELADDLVIPIVDIALQNADEPPFQFLWDEYTWNADSVLMDHECYSDCNGGSPGFGATANSFLPLVNVEEGWPMQDSNSLHRSKDPGVGAFTEYHGRASIATKSIGAGEELYVDYGANWFHHREFLGPIPLYHHLKHASYFFNRYKSLKSSIALVTPQSNQIMEELWDTFVRQTDFPKSRTFGSFHHDKKDELEQLEKVSGSLEKLRRQQSSRSVEWLREHGTCGDHIKAGPSTLPQAGRGAFATRDLPEGTIVAQLPLIHVAERRRLDTYPVVKTNRGPPKPDKNGKKSAQLLLNYCYGHEESTLLLCPYGPTVNFVNHNKTLANVRLQWGDPARGNHMPRLLDSPLHVLESDATAKLAFEFVATRPIRKGEEIFLDYGVSWEQQWSAHMQQWKPVSGAESYIPAHQLQETETRLKTVFEQMSDPYPPNVELQALDQFFQAGWQAAYGGKNFRLELSDGRRGVDILRYQETELGRIVYTVVDHEDNEIHEGLPREAFRFVDKPHTTDMFLENAFRHDIRIPNEIFPEAWKNNKASSSSS